MLFFWGAIFGIFFLNIYPILSKIFLGRLWSKRIFLVNYRPITRPFFSEPQKKKQAKFLPFFEKMSNLFLKIGGRLRIHLYLQKNFFLASKTFQRMLKNIFKSISHLENFLFCEKFSPFVSIYNSFDLA